MCVCGKMDDKQVGGCATAVQLVCKTYFGFVTFWSPSAMEAVLCNHCAQGPNHCFFRFCHILESFDDGGCARQPLRTELRQCVSGQPWACPGPLQGQMHPMQWSAGLVEPAMGAVLGCAGGLRCLRFCHILESFSDGACALQPLRTEPRQCVSGQPWACAGPLQGQMHPVQWSAGLVEPALGAAALLCSLLPVLSHSGVLQ